MHSSRFIFLIAALAALTPLPGQTTRPAPRRLAVRDYRDKMLAGWMGQAAAVTWGTPMEFQFRGEPIPEYMVPKWDPSQINDALDNDDVFNDSVLLYLMDKGGVHFTARDAAIERALVWTPPSQLLEGVAPPDLYARSGRGYSSGLGYQISADITGLVAPGMPNTTIRLGERLTNPFGDSLYAGQFIGAMYGEAFFERSPRKLIGAGLRAIPAGSAYAGMVRDVLRWHDENPADWLRTWKRIQDKYRPRLPANSADPAPMVFDARLNGAYVLTGLLYGDGDLEKSVIIAMRGGDDADCNAANAGGLIATTIGYSRLPDSFRLKLDGSKLLNYLDRRERGVFTFPQVLEKTESVARQLLAAAGGSVSKDAAGEEWFAIPAEDPVPSALYHENDPLPHVGSRLTAAELARVRGVGPEAAKALERLAPGWQVGGEGCELGFRPEIYGRRDVLVTYPGAVGGECMLSRRMKVPGTGWSTVLDISSTHAEQGAFSLAVRVDGREIFVQHNRWSPWMRVKVDLTAFAGREVLLEVLDRPYAEFPHSWAYWSSISVASSSPAKSRPVGFWFNVRGVD